MSAVNPYAPPQANVDDVHEQHAEYQPVKAFSPNGRIGRLRYFAYLAVSNVVLFALSFVIVFAFTMMGMGRFVDIVSYLIIAAYLVWILLLSIQRSHDMDWSGWSGIAAFVPFVGLVWLFKAGSPGVNRYGAPPPPNGRAVKAVLWIFPAIFIFGIIAAIAIPAYQGYVMRAKASQLK
jgi:uncharacterized membrane protein YhaH (DUF805 family)